MAFREDHELHKRRFGKNMALMAVLCGFAALIFGLTIVKVGSGAGAQIADQAGVSQAAGAEQ